MKEYKIQKAKDGWLINERYAIYNDDGVIYDTHEGKDIPQDIFELRDLLVPRITIKGLLEKYNITKMQLAAGIDVLCAKGLGSLTHTGVMVALAEYLAEATR